MLVHAPGTPGVPINEDQPIEPGWAYPKSKAAAEEAIRVEHGRIPYVLLHLAGLYDEKTSVPTLANQIARIYERDVQSYVYSGSTQWGNRLSIGTTCSTLSAVLSTGERKFLREW